MTMPALIGGLGPEWELREVGIHALADARHRVRDSLRPRGSRTGGASGRL